MNEDVELGRVVAHGAIIGAAVIAHKAIDESDELTPAQREFRHDVTALLQVVTQKVVNAAAKEVVRRRNEDAEY
jgi:hypothetical protein